jgi:hypothetical protein
LQWNFEHHYDLFDYVHFILDHIDHDHNPERHWIFGLQRPSYSAAFRVSKSDEVFLSSGARRGWLHKHAYLHFDEHNSTRDLGGIGLH